jgi:hypothetical protein
MPFSSSRITIHDSRFRELFEFQIILDRVHTLSALPAPGGSMATLDLRPLSLGELLDRTFFLYRRHFLLFVGIAAIPYFFFFVVNLGTALIPLIAHAAASDRIQPPGVAAITASGGLFALLAFFVGGVAFMSSSPSDPTAYVRYDAAAGIVRRFESKLTLPPEVEKPSAEKLLEELSNERRSTAGYL